ncbi:MAG: DUF2443 domain-containing protein [Helicobacter sp.]|nr:DUF2443 domain-containing protein [Helicobacter sp.]MDE7255977.1 DUF2443 domain-containing protein [Helicobacter sp.]
MFEKIDLLIRGIETSREEIEILLSMAKISFLDYILIKRGEQLPPDGVGTWTLQQIDMEVAQLREHIEALEKIKNEILM